MYSKPNNLHIPRSELCLSYVHACCLLARWLACWVTADSHDALLNIHPGHDCPMFRIHPSMPRRTIHIPDDGRWRRKRDGHGADTRHGTGSHFATERPSDPGIPRPVVPVDPVTLVYTELQMSTYV